MASIGEVVTSVARACDQASKCRDALGRAQDLAEEAHDLLTANLRGTVHLESDAEQALAAFIAVKDGIADLWGVLRSGMDRAQAALTALTGAALPARPPHRPPTQGAVPDDPPTIPPERIEALRRELPPPVVPATGRKTRGCRIDQDGATQPLVSGRDVDADAADSQLRAMGMPRKSARTGDVEIKMAARMVREGIRHATILINNEPCVGPFGCDTLVPILLPEGSTLTVHGTTEQGEPISRRYAGGARPWWR